MLGLPINRTHLACLLAKMTAAQVTELPEPNALQRSARRPLSFDPDQSPRPHPGRPWLSTRPMNRDRREAGNAQERTERSRHPDRAGHTVGQPAAALLDAGLRYPQRCPSRTIRRSECGCWGRTWWRFATATAKWASVSENCPHRGVLRSSGRNEECGLRCVYHGWKFDITGKCVDMPSEPEESGFAKRIKLKSYPLVERGGVLWAYLGPPERQPALPEWEFALVPDAQRFVSKRIAGMQLAAGHGGRHRFQPRLVPASRQTSIPIRCSRGPGATSTISTTRRPVFEVVESAGGRIGARRDAENGNYYWRITQWVMPTFTMISAARKSPRAWPFLGSHRRRKLLDLEFRLPSDPPGCRRTNSAPCAKAKASTPNACPARSSPSPTKTTTI